MPTRTRRTTTATARPITESEITDRYACNCPLVPGVHPAGQCARLRTTR